MSAAKVHPRLGADQLLLRIGERNKKVNLPFLSAMLAVELRLPRKLCSDTLGRLYRRGDVTRERIGRMDRFGVARGFCFRYQISKKGQRRLLYLKKRESFYDLSEGLRHPGEAARMEAWKPLMNSFFGPELPMRELVKTNRMLAHFAFIDYAGAPVALLASTVVGKDTNQALMTLGYLRARGLACQDLSYFGIQQTVRNGKKAGLTDEEIVLNELFKGALWLRERIDH
jgi:hypothetical protein